MSRWLPESHTRGRSVIRMVCWLFATLPAHAAGEQNDGLARMSLQELSELQVTSVSRTPEFLREAPAAIYVITQDDIRRSGATTLVEALRLAPNLRIAQLGSSNYVASSRGFGGHQESQSFSNKLLMLIDGRSVYSPLFSGIYFDSQDVALEEVSRIEVISGPGATLWGANAVNGVINVITRPAYLAQGAAVSAGGGTDEQFLGIRYGARAGDGNSYRVYAKALRRGAAELAEDVSAEDAWRRAQAGFRFDMTGAGGGITVQGDAYTGREKRPDDDHQDLTGANLLTRWQRQAGRSSLQVQAYFDHVQRETRLQEGLRVNTFDLELQHDLSLGSRHSLVWGAGARLYRYQIHSSASLRFEPESRSLDLWNVFAQDTIPVGSEVELTLGLKLERNDFSGWEPQPELRLSWQPEDATLLWVSAARAIRSPTPFDTDVVEYLGDVRFVTGNPQFRSEQIIAYEAGIRLSLAAPVWISAAMFYHRYDDLRTVEWGDAPTYLPLHWDNLMEGETYGINAWATWQVNDWWRLTPGFELLRKSLQFTSGASGVLDTSQSGNDPRGHASLTSSMDVATGQILEVSVRHIGALPEPDLPAYTELSARYAWQVSPSLELSVRGSNLLHARHREYPASEGRLISRALMAEARWSP